MARALALARKGRCSTRPNPAVGCVLVRDDVVIGEGWHRLAGEPHAEVLALAAAGPRARGATCYVTLEPCSHSGRTGPCTEALIGAGVARVVVAHGDPNPKVAGRGYARLRAAGIDVATGVLEGPAADLNRGYLARMRTGRPFVRAKIAASVDGRTALADGASRWISCADARRDVHRARAASGAVLTGIGTVLRDDPALTVREADLELLAGQPLRVVADSRLRTPVQARLLRGPGAALVFGADIAPARAALEAAGATVVTAELDGMRPSPRAMLEHLAGLEINDVWLEAGPTLTGAFLQAGLIDEFVVYLAPSVLGDRARPMLIQPQFESLAATPRLRIVDERRVGSDLRLTLAIARDSNDARSGFP
jgi:diaminohydroxyphosphoribosylaminopyrimidine deaminase/5-amino-6-(5-phosphoribosylamino)uracil reductase